MTEQGQFTDRFGKAVEQLGSEKLDIRLGGIYALERLARDSPRDYWTTMEVLAAFLRVHAPATRCTVSTPSTDVQAAATVIGRRNLTFDADEGLRSLNRRPDESRPFRSPLDLGGVCLAGAQLVNVDFSDVSLDDANLSDANLSGAELDNAQATGANFTRARIGTASLTGMNLEGANLTGANLTWSDLSRAKLTNADLTNADLTGARGVHEN